MTTIYIIEKINDTGYDCGYYTETIAVYSNKEKAEKHLIDLKYENNKSNITYDLYEENVID